MQAPQVADGADRLPQHQASLIERDPGTLAEGRAAAAGMFGQLGEGGLDDAPGSLRGVLQRFDEQRLQRGEIVRRLLQPLPGELAGAPRGLLNGELGGLRRPGQRLVQTAHRLFQRLPAVFPERRGAFAGALDHGRRHASERVGVEVAARKCIERDRAHLGGDHGRIGGEGALYALLDFLRRHGGKASLLPEHPVDLGLGLKPVLCHVAAQKAALFRAKIGGLRDHSIAFLRGEGRILLRNGSRRRSPGGGGFSFGHGRCSFSR
jgi:hypothetical protein